MKFIFTLFAFLLPIFCFSQSKIIGKILNQLNTRPVTDASVFLSNTSIGTRTLDNGSFELQNVKSGNYELVISIVGFETYSISIDVNKSVISLPDILIFPKTIGLKEVTIKPHDDPDRAKYYEWFKNEFLGVSAIANECKILNPDILDFNYDDTKKSLTVSSSDYLIIKNEVLGYRIKYLLTNFLLQNESLSEKKVYFEGKTLFESMKGSPSDQRHWDRNRQKAYEPSLMHFLRAALANSIDEDGFRVQQLAFYNNPDRPEDSIINKKITYYKTLRDKKVWQRDSLSYWIKKSKLPKISHKINPDPLSSKEFIKATDVRGQFALGCENDELYIAYSKNRKFQITDNPQYLNNAENTETSLLHFNSPYAFFYNNGVIANPYSVTLYGVWGRNRVAELLPVDYVDTKTIAEQDNEEIINNIQAKVDTFRSAHITEKAYLQFDKPYYVAGDTMYFKAYVTMGEKNELSNVSGVLHVDLLSNNNISQSITLKLINGVAWGDFALADNLLKGQYKIRAYTNWMRNDGERDFFVRTIIIGSTLKGLENTLIPTKIFDKQMDLQFFPEGGSMVDGVKSKVAFKAIDEKGNGIDIKGEITDKENREITKFTTKHLGMGCFYLTPQAGETYKAQINDINGLVKSFELPKAGQKGLVLAVNNDTAGKASLRIETNKAFYLENKNKAFNIILLSGDAVITIPCILDSSIIKLDILKRKLHTGINIITLFNSSGEPICERLIFVQNYDQLNIEINSDKSVYEKRSKANINISVKTRSENPFDRTLLRIGY
jgi:hypothetical protein